MTEEQIKQNAEEYARLDNGKDIDCQQYRAYIVGAHSRDEEIKQLEFDNYLRLKKIKTYEEIIEELRNPWISVEERLPKEDKDKPGYSVEVIGMFHSGDIAKCFCSLEERIWFCDILTTYAPIAWMSIPKLKEDNNNGKEE